MSLNVKGKSDIYRSVLLEIKRGVNDNLDPETVILGDNASILNEL